MRPKRKTSPGYRWACSHALETCGARAAWGFQEKLEESQWYRPQAHLAYQLRHLRKLLRHARDTSEHYRQLFSETGVDLDGDLDLDAFRRIPPLTRAMLQSDGDALAARSLPPGHGQAFELRTSGSTGAPVKVLSSDFAEHWHKALTFRCQLWSLNRFDGKLAVIRKYKTGQAEYPEGACAPRWTDEMTLPMMTGPVARLNTSTRIEDQAAWLAEQQPQTLFTFPSNLAALLDYAESEHLGLPGLGIIQTIGETLSPEIRRAARRVWNSRVYDIYSAQEVGHIALQCPERDAYHVPAEAIMVEVLDDDDRPCGPGEIGRVVVTPLFNYAMPLIRYAIGDWAEVGSSCPCGRGLPVLKRILGRQRNIMVLPNGSRHWPSFGTRRFLDIAPIRQHQFIQRSPRSLEARLVTARALSRQEEEKFRAHVLSRLPYEFELTFCYVDGIPRSESGKYEDFICLVEQET